MVVLAEHKAAMGAISSLCSQVDAQPLTPLIQPAIRYAIPPACSLLDDVLNKISVSLCGEERTEEATRQDSSMCVSHQHGGKEREMSEENCTMEKETSTFSRRISGDGNLSRRPLRWNLVGKDVEFPLLVNQQPMPKSVSTLSEQEPTGYIEDIGCVTKDIPPCEVSPIDLLLPCGEVSPSENKQEHFHNTPSTSDDEEF